MNYKIKVTAENRQAIKEIAERNGMNEIGFNFEGPKQIYHIEKGCFTSFPIPQKNTRNYQELTFEQFKAMFDKQETDIEKWLRETKAKNLDFNSLSNITISTDNYLYNRIRAKFDLKGGESLAEYLFNQWNEPKPHGFCEEKNSKCTDNYCDENGCVARKRILTEPKEEWQPKRGDRVLVWNEKEEDAVERMFLSVIKEIENSILVVTNGYEEDFKANKTISISSYEHMKPLPPTKSEKTFKDKVIELAEKRIEHYKICEKESRENSDEHDAVEYKAIYNQFEDFLYKIKELN